MPKKIFILSILLVFISVFLPAAGQTETETGQITVFNAASTTDLIGEISDLFTEKTGIVVQTNPASSGTLAHQIEQGADADVFISASKKWMDYVEELDLVGESSPFVVNRIVLVAPSDSELRPFEITAETDFPALFSGRLSMGDPEHVPAGKYAEEALKHYGWYDEILDRIMPATDVRAALSVVEMGEAELGIVYETDAKKSAKVAVVSRFAEESHSPIEYFCAVLKEGSAEGKAFYDFLLESDEVRDVYAKYGFSFP